MGFKSLQGPDPPRRPRLSRRLSIGPRDATVALHVSCADLPGFHARSKIRLAVMGGQ